MSLELTQRGDVVVFRVRATPRARSSSVSGVSEGVLCVRIAAPPVEGKANAALREFLAEVLGVRTSAVQISAGDRSRHKVVEVRGVTTDNALRALAAYGGGLVHLPEDS